MEESESEPTQVALDAMERFAEVVNVDDPFRIVIRGFVFIDELLDQLICDAFEGGTPPELDRLRLPARLALGRALGVLPEDLAELIGRLGKLRHRFAHTLDDAISEQEVDELMGLAEEHIVEEGRALLASGSLNVLARLRIVVGLTYGLTGSAGDAARERRVEQAAALDLWRQRSILSGDDIRELLASEAEDVLADEAIHDP